VSERLLLELVTPERQILSDEVDEVRLPGALGELGVLPGHTPLLTSLGTGQLAFSQGSLERRFAVQGGFAEVLPNRVTVLAQVAEAADEIDLAAARSQLAEAEAALPAAEADQIDSLTDQLRLATTRIEIGGGAA
jgi:F-type H+-transporting ATPase subunit epsilon